VRQLIDHPHERTSLVADLQQGEAEEHREEEDLQNFAARERVADTVVPDAVLERCARLCLALGTDGLRGELTLMRASRALAALDGATEVADEQLHAQFLANKIVALGGEPVTVPRPVPPAATNRKMLEAVLEAERRATRDYTQRALDAETYGDKGLMVQVEDMVRDESGHAEETERILRDWPL